MNETKNYSITKSGAVILEGGANRGVFTAGALDFLMEQEYYIPHVIGVSAGACNALDYVSRQIGRTRDCMIVTDEKNRYVNKNIKTIVEKKALLDMDMVFERYPYEIFPFDFDTYFASPQTCELVVTNCETGRAEYLMTAKIKNVCLQLAVHHRACRSPARWWRSTETSTSTAVLPIRSRLSVP